MNQQHCWALLLVLMLCGSSDAGFVATPVQWAIADGGNDHYYGLFDSGPITWTDAHDSAAALTFLGSSGHLVTITSSAESSFLESNFSSFIGDPNAPGGLFPPVAGVRAWIGLTDVVNEGNFQWITGEPFSFSNWAGPEPNDLGGEDFVSIWRRDFGSGPQWSWNDSSNAAGPQTAFFVEFEGPFAPVPEPASIVLLAVGCGSIGVARRVASRKN